jgi:hypothetical protein
MSTLPPTITDNSVTLTFGAQGQYYGYCTIADVKYEFPNAQSFSSLNNNVVAQAVTYTAQEFQNVIARIYQMPYSGTDGGVLLTLRMINAKLATAYLLDRYFQGSEPDLSQHAAACSSWAEGQIADIINGVTRWNPPFADAVAMGELPTYPLSSGATVFPNQLMDDPNDANPIFTISANKFRSYGNF